MDPKQVGKAALSGALAALVMFVIIQAAILSGIAPFQMAPSAAFLSGFDIPPRPLALIVHFGYGIVWSIIFTLVLGPKGDWRHGLGLGLLLWLIMMLVASPLIGWGVFGTADTSGLAEGRQLGSPVKYIVATLVLHLIYGGIVGGLNAPWVTAGAANTSSSANQQPTG